MKIWRLLYEYQLKKLIRGVALEVANTEEMAVTKVIRKIEDSFKPENVTNTAPPVTVEVLSSRTPKGIKL